MRLRLLVAALCLFGCQAESSPHLVQVTGLSSDRIAEGDLLELRGSGFPEGRPARVTLRGELYRPGRSPERGFELVLPARSSSPHTVAAKVTRDVERAFTGSGDGHTTFRGSVEAAFFPTSAGTPPVTGGLPAAVIDIAPVGGDALESEHAEARRFAEFIGVLLADDSLVVDGVMPKSRAERAGVARGDAFAELAGVRVLEQGDLVPPPRVRQVELVVHRNGVADPVRLVLETDGFTKPSPRELAPAAAVLAAALAFFALLRSSLGRALSFIELRSIELVRSWRERRQKRSFERSSRRREVAIMNAVLPSAPVAYLALAGATGLIVYLGIGGTLVAREVDLAALMLGSIVATGVTALVFGAPGERSLGARLRRLGCIVAHSLSVLAALACAAFASGGFGVEELSRAQGPLPWEWHAFRGPALLAAASVFVVALVPEPARGSHDPRPTKAAHRALTHSAAEAVGWAHLVLASGIGSFAFLGGARASALGAAPTASLGAALVAAGVVLIKAFALIVLVSLARVVIGRLDVREITGLTLRVLAPVAALAAGTTAFLQRGDVRPIAGDLDGTLGVSCFLAVLVLAAVLARRIVSGSLGRDAEQGVNPWI